MPNRARVSVKDKPMTRAQAAAEFGRKKAKLRRQQHHRRALSIVIGLFSAYVLVIGILHMRNGKVEEAVHHWQEGFWRFTASVGFRLDQVTLNGRSHADAASVREALGITQGQPILAVSLVEMKARIEKIAEVKSVTIHRQLPNELVVTLVERSPAAWWQHEGTQQLVDAEGVPLAREKYHEKLVLPVMVGADAPKHVDELLALLEAAPALKPDVVAAVRVGERRWNIELSRNITVLLPEEKPIDAWKRFATLAEKEALLSKAIRSVDMRIEDRVFIMPLEPKQAPITLTGARET